MKRTFLIFFTLVLLFVTGCAATRTDITREEVVAVYEKAGYEVFTGTYDEKLDSGLIAYVQANHPNGDYIYFSFFENEKDARAYEKEMDHPVMKYLFSVIFGDPTWERLETYGCIVVSYDDPNHFYPFDALLTAK